MRIGIIGSSSQVGSSLAFYLKYYTDEEPVCFIRSSYSIVFFEALQIEYRFTGANGWVKEDFADIDTVIDCTYPSGQLYEIRKLIDIQLTSLFTVLRPGTTFIYLSTIMAFGMPDGYNRVTNFVIPRSTYAFLKRFAERKVRRLSNRYNIHGFNFRLGQVHGFLQSVNSSYREKLSHNQDIILNGTADSLVNIIFINTLSEAIIKASTKQISPSTYSLVNYPQWTLIQLYDYYRQYYSLQNKLIFINRQKVSLQQRIKEVIIKKVKNYRPLFESFFLIKNRNLYAIIKGKYRVLNVKDSILPAAKDGFTDFHLLGKNPGKMINNLSCSTEIVFDKEKKMESMYNQLLMKNTESIPRT